MKRVETVFDFKHGASPAQKARFDAWLDGRTASPATKAGLVALCGLTDEEVNELWEELAEVQFGAKVGELRPARCGPPWAQRHFAAHYRRHCGAIRYDPQLAALIADVDLHADIALRPVTALAAHLRPASHDRFGVERFVDAARALQVATGVAGALDMAKSRLGERQSLIWSIRAANELSSICLRIRNRSFVWDGMSSEIWDKVKWKKRTRIDTRWKRLSSTKLLRGLPWRKTSVV